MIESKKAQGLAWACLACAFSASIWIFPRELSPEISAPSQVVLRLILGSFFFVIIFFKKISFKKFESIPKTDWFLIIARSVLFYLLGTVLATLAIQKTSYGNVVLILSMPFAAFFGVVLLKEYLNFKKNPALSLSIFGMSLIILDRHGLGAFNSSGEFYALLSSLLMSLGLILRRFNSNALNEFELTFLVLGLSAIMLTCLIFFIQGNIDLPISFGKAILVVFSGLWTAGFLYSISKALMACQLLEVNLVFGFQPLVGSLIGIVLYNEKPSVFSLLATALLALSICVLNIQKLKK